MTGIRVYHVSKPLGKLYFWACFSFDHLAAYLSRPEIEYTMYLSLFASFILKINAVITFCFILIIMHDLIRFLCVRPLLMLACHTSKHEPTD